MKITKSRLAAVAAIALASVLGFSNAVAFAATFPTTYLTAADITPNRAADSATQWYGEKNSLGVYTVNAASFDGSEALEIKNTNSNDSVRILNTYGPTAVKPTIAQILNNASYTYSGSNVAFTIEMFYTPVDGATYGPTGTSPCTAANQTLYPGQCYTVIKWEPLDLSAGAWKTVDLTADVGLTSTTGGWKNTNRIGIYAKPGPMLGNSMTEYLSQIQSYTILGVGPALGSGSANQTGYVKNVDFNARDYQFRMVAPTVADAPTNVVASLQGNSLHVEWTPPANDGGSPVFGYFTRIHASNTEVVNSVATPAGSSFTFFPADFVAEQGVDYYVTMVASNSVGFSTASNQSNTVSLPPLEAPGVPQNVTATSGANSVNVAWTAPTNDGGSAITGYTVKVYSTAANELMYTGTADSDDTNLVIAHSAYDAVSGAGYYATVSASNAQGSSAPSTNNQNSTFAAPFTVPGAPTNVAATLSGASNIAVTWTPPTNDGGTELTSYLVRVHTTDGQVVANVLAPLGNSFTVNAEDYLPEQGRSYYVTTVATNEVGNSVESNLSSNVLVATTPTAPQNVAAVVLDNNVTVNWNGSVDNGGSSVTGYYVTILNAAGTEELYTKVITGSAIHTTNILKSAFDGVNETDYIVVVAATNAIGRGTYSTVSAQTTFQFQTAGPTDPPVDPITTAPDAPTGVTATLVPTTGIKVDWVAPASDGGSPITAYAIKVYSSTDVLLATIEVPVGTTYTLTATDYNGELGKSYNVRVAAVNTKGASDYTAKSTAATVTTSNSPAIPPAETMVDGNKSGVAVVVVADKDLVATIPSSVAMPGDTVYGFAYSTPIALGPAVVAGNGTATWANVTSLLPAGQHRLAVTKAAGTILGWGTMTITAAAGQQPAANGGTGLAATGANDAELALTIGGIGGSALIGALALFFVYRRRTATQK